jgi:hypothetical protein
VSLTKALRKYDEDHERHILKDDPKKSFDPRKTQKARKYSKRYQTVERHPKGE